MKHITILFRTLNQLLRIFIIGATFYAPCANAQTADKNFADAFRDALLIGCLPNAMDMHPFIPERAKELDASGIKLSSDIPPDVLRALLLNRFPDTITAVQKDFPDKIILASTPANHLCRIAIANMDVVQARNVAINELQMKGSPWKPTQSFTEKGIQFDSYIWETENKPTNLMINISGPVQTIDNGKGMQLLITVAQVKKDTQ